MRGTRPGATPCTEMAAGSPANMPPTNASTRGTRSGLRGRRVSGGTGARWGIAGADWRWEAASSRRLKSGKGVLGGTSWRAAAVARARLGNRGELITSRREEGSRSSWPSWRRKRVEDPPTLNSTSSWAVGRQRHGVRLGSNYGKGGERTSRPRLSMRRKISTPSALALSWGVRPRNRRFRAHARRTESSGARVRIQRAQSGGSGPSQPRDWPPRAQPRAMSASPA